MKMSGGHHASVHVVSVRNKEKPLRACLHATVVRGCLLTFKVLESTKTIV